MVLVELSDLGPGAPAGVAVTGLVQISICYLFETAKAVKSSCQFAGERLVLEEAALRRQADRLLVQRHGLDVPSFEARPFRRDQDVFMRERRRAALSPSLKRPQVSNEVFAKLCPSLRRGRWNDRRDGQRMIEAVVHRLKIKTGRPENRLRPGGELKGSLRIAQQDVPLQLQDPVKTGNQGDAAPEHPRFQRRLVEGRAAPRSPAKTLDETLNAQDDQLTEFVFAHEIQGFYRLEPHLVERIAARHEIGEAMLTGEAGVNHLAGFPDRSSRGLEAGQSVFNWTRPQDRHLHEEMRARLLRREPVSFCDCNRQPCKRFPVSEAMEHRAKSYGNPGVTDRREPARSVPTGQPDHP